LYFTYIRSLISDPSNSNIILSITNPLDPDNTNNQVILILKYYLYKCRCLGDKTSIYGGLKYLKYSIKIEKTTINCWSSMQKEYICKKWLPFETVLGVWNFSAVLQNVCFYKLNVVCLCTLYNYVCHVVCLCTLYNYVCHVVCLCTLYNYVRHVFCICLCFSLKINKLQKNL
jgi:hypothetical protein